MDVSLILRIAGVGVLVSVVVTILNKSGRDEQAMLLTVAGILVVMLMLVEEIGALFESVQSIFGFCCKDRYFVSAAWLCFAQLWARSLETPWEESALPCGLQGQR